MSDDHTRSIDNMLSETLPDNPEEVSEETPAEQKEKMITLLKNAKEDLGRSPSLRQFNSLDLEVSGYVIESAFGTWNEAKREAGLEVYERGEGKHAITEINEQYFSKLDSSDKAYWLGTLIAYSSIQRGEGQVTFHVSRPVSKEHFVRGFSKAIESKYSIRRLSPAPDQEQERVETIISNRTFINNLLSAGYPDPEEQETEIPALDTSLRAPFVRGYLESGGYFTAGSGWGIPVDCEEGAERLQEWFESFGAKRPTIGQSYGNPCARVANIFDIKSVFEECWPQGVSTEPSYTPYPKKILKHLESEYPYPENVDYLSD
ncbi:homing endonuclease associated repeat-containing protein [Haloarcula sp. CBA1127]|uniref:homing endonuclease associated repeat-containing protein n=1 Tax=Haloarcula sp. CBA1127 TaxID=1765055 RepID=UPI00073F804D|nr:hypothetical protein [Haloarcula sp. CBA1127]